MLTLFRIAMKKITLLLFSLFPLFIHGQIFDFYGPQPFGEILETNFGKSWTPSSISAIQNREFVVFLDSDSKTSAISLSTSDYTSLEIIPASEVTSTYGSVSRSIFQIVDTNTHLDQQEIPLAGVYSINAFLHSYYSLNAIADGQAALTDRQTKYIVDQENSGFVSVNFIGSPESVVIQSTAQYVYSSEKDTLVEIDSFTSQWLKIEGTSASWTSVENEASTFYLADATDLIDLKIEDGSAFNPLNVEYQPNATAALPEVGTIEDSPILNQLTMDIDEQYLDQFGTSVDATVAATSVLTNIETRLINNGATLRYPKEFYLAVRENMLSHKIASTDTYNGRLDYNTIPHVYFTNATDDEGIPHPFMVITSHATSTRPNLLVDVNRPPGAEQGIGYAQSTVTRNGKLGEFLAKIPLKDYGLIDNLLDNDLSPYGDLANDFDDKQGTTTEKTVYNYAGLASVGMAVDGVTIYPAQNNNLRFAVEDGEVTHSGIHVGGGLELHYHADGHAYSGNGINLYNISDYEGHDHPPVIGMAYDGIALFGKYEANYSSMIGFGEALDEFGGHDHNDGFGYHYHAHTQTVTGSDPSETMFNEHFLLVGAWKGNINSIPGFDEGKLNQLKEPSIARYAGAPYEEVVSIEENPESLNGFYLYQNYPNPFNPSTTITYELSRQREVQLAVFDVLGREVAVLVNNKIQTPGSYSVNFNASGLSSGVYTYQLTIDEVVLKQKMTLIK